MPKRLMWGVGLLAALAAMPKAGSAQNVNVCTTAGFIVCVDFNLVFKGLSSGVNNYALNVTYGGPTPSISAPGSLTAFGFYWLTTPTIALTPDSVLAPAGSSWATGSTCTQLSGGGTITLAACSSANPPPVGNGLAPGQTASLYFHTLTSVSLANIDAALTYNSSTATLGDRAFIQGFGPRSCSIKVDALQPNNVVGGGTAYIGDCGAPTTVPEPSVLMLLGSGMMGLGFAGVRRRFLS